MIGRRPTKADALKLARALELTAAPAPDPYAFITHLVTVILASGTARKGGRPRKRTPERDRKLLEWFKQLKAIEEGAQNRELTDKECIEAFAKKHKGKLLLKPKTILTWLSDARKRADRADAP
jgi:hypothetical protein